MSNFDRIREIISKQLDVEAAAITMEAKLVDDLKADSLDVVELIMDLEQEFDIEIPDEELPKVRTVGDIVEYVEKH